MSFRGRGAPLTLMYRKCAEILGQLQMPISWKQKRPPDLRWWQNDCNFEVFSKNFFWKIRKTHILEKMKNLNI